MNDFEPFDPLRAKSLADTEVAVLAQKRELKNILGSYVGWYDPFCELIQNALDSLDERAKKDENFEPTIWIDIDIKGNSLSVTDNGVGLEEKEFQQFLCPDISFKSGKTRGHKGVGATYLAYGFNFIQVSTKTNNYSAVGKMEGSRNWIDDESPSGNPHMKPDSMAIPEAYSKIDRGASIFVRFDSATHPGDLKWIVADKADQWLKLLSVKTGLGSILPNDSIRVRLKVIDKDGNQTVAEQQGIGYYFPHLAVPKVASVVEIKGKMDEQYAKNAFNAVLPSRYKNLDAFYQEWSAEDLLQLCDDGDINLDDEEKSVVIKYEPRVYAAYVYSLKVWEKINESLGVRQGQRILYGGIQIAANNMPQGETIQIPLNRNIGRQNQIQVLIHFSNCSPDLGRKGFQSEVVTFAKDISKKLADGPLAKVKHSLRANSGTAPNLSRQEAVDNWKNEMSAYEETNPLVLVNENFFLPSRKIAITSVPTREQDVIALFNQLIAGGVIRGIRIMSTNERLTYDGLFRIAIDNPRENHLFDIESNPLGIDLSVLEAFEIPFLTNPKVLEYKYSLDGLVEDVETGLKNSNDIGLVVVWETGEEFRENYKITSFLDPDNLNLREFHGVTHCMTNLTSQQREMELIVLKELIDFLNNREVEVENQRQKYED